jgi:hypothetical protein
MDRLMLGQIRLESIERTQRKARWIKFFCDIGLGLSMLGVAIGLGYAARLALTIYFVLS